MANTYTQIHIQAVFTVQNRDCIIHKNWKDELYKYITGIVQQNNHKLLACHKWNAGPYPYFVWSSPNPVFIRFDAGYKGNSSKWINEKRFVRGKFSWQEGYGAFSYSKSELPGVIRYIKDQQNHHRHKGFIEEYLEMLREFEIDFDDKYVFKPVGIDYTVPDGTF